MDYREPEKRREGKQSERSGRRGKNRRVRSINVQMGGKTEIAALVDRRTRVRATEVLVLCGILLFAVLLARLWKLMIVDHTRYENAAVETQIRSTDVSAVRGTIYDTGGKILAQSAAVETIVISPHDMIRFEEDPEMIAAALSEILGVDYDSIMAKWKKTDSWYEVIKRKVEKEQADMVRAFKKEHELVSVFLEEDSRRYYPYGTLAAQVLGFVGTDNNGLEGIEAKYEEILKGENGRVVRTTNVYGKDLLFTGYEDYHDAMDGGSIVLTIDNTIQYYLKKNMEQAISDNQIRSGAMGIVMDVDTAAVLGMVTLPDFDCNDWLTLDETYRIKLDSAMTSGTMNEEELNAYASELLMKQWRNRAIADTYEPGSTFKIITLAAALEEGVVGDGDLFDCGGSMRVKGRTEDLHCWKDAGHGLQTLKEAAQHSCNVAFATIGIRLGAKTFYDYMESFGFFEKTGIDLPGESGSIWWSASQFEDPNNYSQLAAASFGQTFNITPIQLITAVSAVANGGYLMKPHVVRQVLDSDGNVVQNYAPTVVRQVISEETSRKVCEILESVVSAPGATGKNAGVAGYRIGGKTATSEKVGQASDEYMVSFVGIAPADDPKVAVLVIFDNPDPNSGIYISGGVMAAPCVGNIMADILPYLGIKEAGEGINVNSSVPNVKSKSLTDAAKDLISQGFQYKIVGDGDTVTDQAPVGGMKIANGSTVVLYAGQPKPTDKVIVPDMLGKSFNAAKQYFEAFGMFVKTVGVAPSNSSTIVVQRQGIEPGTTVNYGTVIEVGLIDNDSSIMETRG